MKRTLRVGVLRITGFLFIYSGNRRLYKKLGGGRVEYSDVELRDSGPYNYHAL